MRFFKIICIIAVLALIALPYAQAENFRSEQDKQDRKKDCIASQTRIEVHDCKYCCSAECIIPQHHLGEPYCA
ncbi:hypothetical protein TTHERM_01034480 (macronuclear) [Tetrahymena thermophila SB210]|uniref:Transmembrane protein n=1 Tax=Tetrahymena thermophila (strain SB210) TaxID=312017 RepID=Q235I1_TETTS|nr:hypothetical protein TTHERM_01034480 [Tetrahymena thermophila SB210]EAR92220.2 hypothetical protein TTHERM_01034480 [Tetrahymena thermophila SB210]|eukprot:XP_001012465.2 hypothetical protein TTHERM_01034480 [Tetrahymena thermophila SB210]